MQINGLSQLHGAQSISGPHAARAPQADAVSRSAAAGDQLEISDAGQIAARMSEIPDIRHDKVQALRLAIQNGTYETADKLNTAVSRLFDEIG